MLLGITPMPPATASAGHDHQDRCDCESVSACACLLLPAELLLGIISLCQPAPRLPATCRVLSASLSPGSPPRRIWTQHLAHHTIFRNPEHSPKVVNSRHSPNVPHHNNNDRCPSLAQIESPLSYYLKASMPVKGRSKYWCASGLAPEPGTQVPATIFSWDLVQELFCSSGPFAKSRRQTSGVGLVAMLEHIRPADIFDDDGSGQSAFALTWSLVPDAFLLATFFLRTSQLDLLRLTLTHLRSLFPNLGTDSAPFPIWARLMLDSRTHILSWLATMAANSDAPMTYPTFLCLIALIDWSLPALEVISRVFPDSLDATATANHVTSSHPLFSCLMLTLRHVTSPASSSARVIDILGWLRNHGAHINLEHFASISIWTSDSYPIFLDVFRYHDLSNLPVIARSSRAKRLGSKIAAWISKGHLDLLSVALDHGLFDATAKGRILHYAASSGDKTLESTVATRCIQNDQELQAVVLHALRQYPELHPPAYARLFNFLAAHSSASDAARHPSDFILDHARTIQRKTLHDMLFICNPADLLFAWDYPKHLHQHLIWVADWAVRRGARVDSDTAAFMAKLVHRCIAVDKVALEDFSTKELATMCAMLLGGLMLDLDGGKAVAAVGASQRAAIKLLVWVVKARMRHARSSTPPLPLPGGRPIQEQADLAFSKLIPRAYRYCLHDGIATAASLHPRTPCVCESFMHRSCAVAHPLAAHNVLVDRLLLLDRGFVLASVPTKVAASVRVWSRFDAAEIASQLYWHRALSLLRQAVELGGPKVTANVTALVDAFPPVVLGSGSFAHGVYGLMKRFPRRKAEFALGLDQSRWRDWAERVARKVPLPQGGEL